MSRPILALAALAALLPLSAHADDLDRYRIASEAMEAKVRAFYTERVPELAAVLPELGWDDEIAVVARCTLDGIKAAEGEAALANYLTAFEAWAAAPITSFQSMADSMPSELSTPDAIDLSMSCGGVELSMQRMEASGMMALMSDPTIMQRLMAE